MKYSIRGHLNTADDTKIKGVINRYRVLDKESLKPFSGEDGKPQFTFELETVELSKKNGIFSEMKSLVDEYSGSIDWHECRHDEGNNMCAITEEYRR
jgi:hypothetical protein